MLVMVMHHVVGDERHYVLNCPRFQSLWQQHAEVFQEPHGQYKSTNRLLALVRMHERRCMDAVNFLLRGACYRAKLNLHGTVN